MFANEFQGGTHVEVLGTQGQNPLAQWKVSGPQKGVQKVYDKALKGYVFVSSGACRLALPKDERSALALVQPYLLLQLEVGVGTPFSVEVGLSDASATRRRIILSSSFSELKCTPLHCQVPFTCLPRECWLNLVLPLSDLSAVLFKGSGGGGAAGGGAGAGGAAAGAGSAAAAAAAAGSSLSATAAAASLSYRTLDSLQLAGTCRLRRICTLRDAPQPTESVEGGGGGGVPAKPLEFPAGVDHQTLLLDPRSLALVGINTGGSGGGGGSPNQTTALGSSVSSGSAGAGLGVVGTSTGSSRRPANGGATSPLPGVNGVGRAGASAGAHGGAARGGAASAAAASAGDVDDVVIGGGGGGEPPNRRSSSGASTPLARTGSAVPTLPPALGAAPGPGHHHHLHHGGGGSGSEHGPTPSRLGRTPSGGFGALNNNNGPSSPTPQSGAGSGPGSACGSGPLPSLDSSSTGGNCSCSSAGGGGGGLKLPRVQCGANGSAAAAAAAAAAVATASSPSGGDDAGRGDGSPFGSRRALSAQTPPRQCGGATPPGSAGGTGAGGGGGGAAVAGGGAVAGGASGCGGGGGGGASGKPPAPPWSGSGTSKRAQSGPARISTESLSQGLGDTMAPADTPMSPSLAPRQARRAQNTSHIPPTISEHEAAPPASSGGAGTPLAKSPARSPSRTRPQPSAGAAAPAAGASGQAAAATGGGGALRPGGGSGAVGDPPTASLPHLRHMRTEAAAAASPAAGRDHPASPAASAVGASSGSNPFAQLSSVLTIRGGMEASIDFGAHSHLLDGSPGSSSILSSNLRISSVIGHAHRYGNGNSAANGGGAAAAVAAPPGASADAGSDSDCEPVLSPSGGGCGGSTGATVAAAVATASATVAAAAAATDAVAVKVPRIRTRVLPGGGAAGGGGGGGAAGGGKGPSTAAAAPASDVASGRSPATPAAVPNSPSHVNRSKGASGSDVDTPTRAGRSGLMSALSQNGRNSPANTPSRAGGGAGGRATPMQGGGGGGAGPGPSSLGPNANGVRQRRDDGAAGGRPPAPAAPAAAGAGGGGPPAPGGGRPSGAGGTTLSKPSAGGGGAGSVCSSPARQRPTAPSSATRGLARPGPSCPPAADNRDRERLPPLAAGGSTGARGRGVGGGAAAGRGGGGVGGGAAAAAGGTGRGGGAVAGRGVRPRRPTTSNEVDVEESITLNAGLWGGFGVDEDDDMLGSRHFRSGGVGGSSGSDGELGGGNGNMPPSTPSLRGGLGASAAAAGSSSLRRASRSNSPDAPRAGGSGGLADELPSPPNHYAAVNGLLSPPIRRVSDIAAAGPMFGNAGDAGPVFAGFQAPAGRRRSGTADAVAEPPPPLQAARNHVLDSLLDEETLLAGHVRDLDHYDEWARVDQRPTPPDLLHPHRAFTPPVVPASKSLGVGLAGGRASGGRGGGRGGGSGSGIDPQVLRLSGAAAAAARGGREQGVVVAGGGEAMLDLVYDPVLNCYYDGATGQYYELKT